MLGAASKNFKTFRRLKISDRLLYIFWICLSILHYLKTSFNCKYLEIQLFSVHIILYERKIQITWKPSNFSYLRLKSLADASGELDSLSCFSRVGSIQGVISFLFNKIDNFFFKLIKAFSSKRMFFSLYYVWLENVNLR